MLANFGERNTTVRTISLIASAAVAVLAGLYGVLVAENPKLFQATDTTGIALVAGAALGLIFLLPPVQRAVASIIPLRPGSPVAYLTVVLALLLVAQEVGAQVIPGKPLTFGDLLAQDVPLLILCFVGVGVFVRRSPRQTLERLGLLSPRQKRWWLVGVLGIGVFIAVAFGIEAVANVVSPSQQKQVTDVTTVLFSHFNNPAAIIFLGVLAAVVEETLFRGALLPRFGIVISSVLFAALHTQYALSFATLEVFTLGLGLGWLRVRAGSILPSMVTHAGYDIAVGFLSLIAK